MTKQAYEAPAILSLGAFEEITRGNTGGATLDAAIPVGTPLTQIPGFAANHTS
jgi:hypothetical protein